MCASRNVNPNALTAEVGALPWKIDRIRQLRGWHPDGVASALQAVAAHCVIGGERNAPRR